VGGHHDAEFFALQAGGEIAPWRKLTRPERAAIDEAAQAYARFVGLPAAVTLTGGS